MLQDENEEGTAERVPEVKKAFYIRVGRVSHFRDLRGVRAFV